MFLFRRSFGLALGCGVSSAMVKQSPLVADDKSGCGVSSVIVKSAPSVVDFDTLSEPSAEEQELAEAKRKEQRKKNNVKMTTTRDGEKTTFAGAEAFDVSMEVEHCEEHGELVYTLVNHAKDARRTVHFRIERSDGDEHVVHGDARDVLRTALFETAEEEGATVLLAPGERRTVATRPARTDDALPRVRLSIRPSDRFRASNGVALSLTAITPLTTLVSVDNRRLSPVTFTFSGDANNAAYLTASGQHRLRTPFTFVCAARAVTPIAAIEAASHAAPWSYSWHYSWRNGSIRATRDASTPLLLPVDPALAKAVARDAVDTLPADDKSMTLTTAKRVAASGVRLAQVGGGQFSHQTKHAIDWVVPEGSPVRAIADGVVVAAVDTNTLNKFQACDVKRGDAAGARACKAPRSGANVVVVRHDDDLYSQYAHLAPKGVLVRHGQRVRRGDVLGFSGNTGFSSGPHLHFDYYRMGSTAALSLPANFEQYLRRVAKRQTPLPAHLPNTVLEQDEVVTHVERVVSVDAVPLKNDHF